MAILCRFATVAMQPISRALVVLIFGKSDEQSQSQRFASSKASGALTLARCHGMREEE
jgi:hypothetical protein